MRFTLTVHGVLARAVSSSCCYSRRDNEYRDILRNVRDYLEEVLCLHPLEFVSHFLPELHLHDLRFHFRCLYACHFCRMVFRSLCVL